MTDFKYDVIIVGGSAAGLSAAMTLGRSLRRVLVIDNCQPCNVQTPRSHNFITNDGRSPAEITEAVKRELANYETVENLQATVADIRKADTGFVAITSDGERITAKKILLSTGLRDITPDVEGFRECWGISVLHCPYCHGYEVRGKETAILANGEAAYHLGTLISNWTPKITVLTNGVSQLRQQELEKLQQLGVAVNEAPIERIVHENGYLSHILFQDGTRHEAAAMYASIPFEQQSPLAEKIGCKMTGHGHIDVDQEQRTSIEGVYAAGDCTAQHRAISVASASGTRAGFTINAEMVIKD